MEHWLNQEVYLSKAETKGVRELSVVAGNDKTGFRNFNYNPIET